MELRRALTRLAKAAEGVVGERSIPELAELAHVLQSETRQLVNGWVNDHANPATLKKLERNRETAKRQGRLLGNAG